MNRNNNMRVRNIIFVFLVLFSFFSITGCGSEEEDEPLKPVTRPLNTIEKKFIATDFKLLYHRGEFPADIINTISPVAYPGEPYNSTDYISDSNIPGRLIIFGGLANDIAFVLYEQGGYGTHLVLILFDVKNNKIQPKREYILWADIKNISDLKLWIEKKAWVVTYKSER